MEHTPSKVKVFQTSNYKLFKLIDGNRAINKNKIDRIIKEIKAGNDVLDQSPILVTESKSHLEVKDGQHRLIVAETLKRPIHYIVKKQTMSLHNIATVNSNTERWKATDFINCYAKVGNENYIQLGKFYKKYGIAVGVCLTLLSSGGENAKDGGSTTVKTLFEQGLFVVKKYKDAVMVAETCKSFELHSGWNSRGFINAIIKILQHGECDFDVLKKKFLRDPLKLTAQPNWKGYCDNLQRIYNFDNSKQRVIY